MNVQNMQQLLRIKIEIKYIASLEFVDARQFSEHSIRKCYVTQAARYNFYQIHFHLPVISVVNVSFSPVVYPSFPVIDLQLRNFDEIRRSMLTTCQEWLQVRPK